MGDKMPCPKSPLHNIGELKMKAKLFAVACCLMTGLFAHTASATLIVSVTGVSGSGQTTWTLSGSSTADSNGTVRTSTGTSFNAGDTMELDGPGSGVGDFIIPATIQNDVFAVSGAASITVGADTETITHIFLDDDGINHDDFGIRTATSFAYLSGEASSWTGSFTVNLDIDTFNPGTYDLIGAAPGFSLTDDIDITFAAVAVPEPGTLAILGLGLAGLGMARRRKAA